MTNLTLNSMGKNLVRNTAVLRADSLLTVEQTAKVTGVSERTLNRIELAKKSRRSYNPMLHTVVKLAEASGVTVDDYISKKLTFQ